jgi:hypothetical protein
MSTLHKIDRKPDGKIHSGNDAATGAKEWHHYFYSSEIEKELQQGICTEESFWICKPEGRNNLPRGDKKHIYDTVMASKHKVGIGYILRRIPSTLLVCAKCDDRQVLAECINCSSHLSKLYSEDVTKNLMCNACGAKHQQDKWICNKCDCVNKANNTIFHEVEIHNFVSFYETDSCFVATACYGNYNTPEVIVLRQYRDQVLLPTYFGALFVKYYYAISPPLANLIAKSDTTKKSIRKYFLQPIVNLLNHSKNEI